MIAIPCGFVRSDPSGRFGIPVESENRTVIDIETEDRLGLLYVISQTLAELRMDISLAKISTEKGAAIDSFYVAELDGQKILSPSRQQFIEKSLRSALAGMGG